MPSHQGLATVRSPPLLVVGVAAVTLTLGAMDAQAQAFNAAGSSLSHYTQAKIAPHMSCEALGQYSARDVRDPQGAGAGRQRRRASALPRERRARA